MRHLLPKLAIVGGGIGGLTAALALNDAGLEVEVFEQASELQEAGAGIQLTPNATRILRALHLLYAVQRHSFHPEAVQFRAARSGFVIARLPLGAFAEQRYKAPYLQVHRDDLHRVLRDGLEARGIPLHLSKVFTDYAEGEREIELRFADGSTAHCDALIGADGIKSLVQARMFGEKRPDFTGHMAWRGLVAAERVPQDLVEPNVTAWLGARRHFVHYYVRGGELINFVGVVETERWREESWSIPGDPAELSADFADWHPGVRQLIEASEHCYKWALYDREPLTRWTRGRVTLLGDACHPMRPFLAQGAAMAIEDAWVLGRLFEIYEEEVEHALAEYERYRLPRTRYVQRQSKAQGEMYHLSSPVQQLARNARLAVGSRFMPDLAMQRFDWLFGYDVIRAFD